MPYSKLDIINTCLGLTGNNLVDVEDDGSDEWNVGSLAYEAAVATLLAGHEWKFETAIAILTRLGDSDDDHFKDIYAKPTGCLGLIWVRQCESILDWRVTGNNIYTTIYGGNTEPVKAKYVLRGDPSVWNPLFVDALYAFTKAGMYSGLNEDPAEARVHRAEGEAKIAMARSYSDREDKPRQGFRSTMLLRRRGLTGYYTRIR